MGRKDRGFTCTWVITIKSSHALMENLNANHFSRFHLFCHITAKTQEAIVGKTNSIRYSSKDQGLPPCMATRSDTRNVEYDDAPILL